VYVEYNDYPNDIQDIDFVVQSYSFQSNFVNLSFTPACSNPDDDAYEYLEEQCHITLANGQTFSVLPPVTVVNNVEGALQGRGGPFSPLWFFLDDSFEVEFFAPDGASYPQLLLTLTVQRESSGITYRLAFPIMLLLLLVGLTFWSESGARVDTTITILLAVSALYIVIFSSIPMLAYLTRFDYYILGVSSCICSSLLALDPLIHSPTHPCLPALLCIDVYDHRGRGVHAPVQ
jgi:hypothetical protein